MHLAAALALAGTGQVFAGDGAAAKADASATTASRDLSGLASLDELIVTGKLDSPGAVKAALLDSENRFNARYNELNKDDDYDIVCRDETPTGSHIPVRSCQAKIVDEETAEQGQAFFRNLATGAPTWIVPPESLRRQAMFEVAERTLVLLKSDPELRRDLLEHVKLEQLYKELSKKKKSRASQDSSGH